MYLYPFKLLLKTVQDTGEMALELGNLCLQRTQVVAASTWELTID